MEGGIEKRVETGKDRQTDRHRGRERHTEKRRGQPGTYGGRGKGKGAEKGVRERKESVLVVGVRDFPIAGNRRGTPPSRIGNR